jgi:hypothetical protein
MPAWDRKHSGDTDGLQEREAVRQHIWGTILSLVLVAVAAHSIGLGVAFLFFPRRILGLVGWEYTGPVFWPSQAGLFLLILGAAYILAIRLRPLVWLVIGSKVSAFIFLLVSALWVDAPPIVALLGCGDGLMGLAVAVALWRLRGAEAARGMPQSVHRTDP